MHPNRSAVCNISIWCARTRDPATEEFLEILGVMCLQCVRSQCVLCNCSLAHFWQLHYRQFFHLDSRITEPPFSGESFINAWARIPSITTAVHLLGLDEDLWTVQFCFINVSTSPVVCDHFSLSFIDCMFGDNFYFVEQSGGTNCSFQ